MEQKLIKLEQEIEEDCLIRIHQTKNILNAIENAVKRNRTLNDLGELQSLTTVLDCRLASLATLRKVLEKNNG